MAGLRLKKYKGLTLIEVLLAALVLSIAILGTITYRYYSALDGRRALIHATATRTAQLLTESWQGTNGSQSYDPVSHLSCDNLTITTGIGPQAPDGFTSLDSYELLFNNMKFYATLSYKDLQPGLRALNVALAWSQRDKSENNLDDMDKLLQLTTYALTQ